MQKIVLGIAVIAIGSFFSVAHAGDLYVIAHPSSTLTEADVADVFTGDKALAGSVKLVPVDNSAAQADMLAKVVKQELAKYNSAWTKKSFRDGLAPPAVKSGDLEVIEFVKKNPGAVGYVSSNPSGVKILHKY